MELSTIKAPSSNIKKNKIEPPKRVFFFEQSNGNIISCGNAEAWHIMKGRNQILGQGVVRSKFLGSSDGTIFHNAVVAAHKLFDEGQIDKAKELIREGEAQEREKAIGNMVYPIDIDTVGNGAGFISSSKTIR